ncbi:hypothetical protein DUNSADRAFT_8649 [Dunaliella salina]|uniref:C962R-like N-terminal AEP domain-containing protein n=1 Tax=Dunaliella salina TaxID=3046 RepID=A0ABQ7GJ55_DUNSA|nr:hypothetical protein DUNSADRAFT_8649 [Dunaliella salina]|eukprot:KAF5834641.1 hypothetical protein DUNSADRAFT_8649 [Dunaliella salina]
MAQGPSTWKLPTAGSNLLQQAWPVQQRTRRRHINRVQQAQDGLGLPPPPPQPVQPQAQSPEAAGAHAQAQVVSNLQQSEQLEQGTEQHSMQLQAREEAPAGSGLSPTSPNRHLEATGQPRQRGQAPHRRGSRGQPYLRTVYRWPRWRDIHDRPQFLERYPCRDGQMYNVNSFLGKLDPHGGKYYVPPRQYAKFLEEYHQALEDGYLLFLTENYHTQPFRFFMELDFDWEVPDTVVEEVLPQIIDTIIKTAQEFYQVPMRPFHVISMRTIHKVHLNFPEIITTELLAHMCRDRVIAACREVIGNHHADWLDWERVVDFSHGSFRLMGSHKPIHIQRDPPWVYDKAYYKVNFRPNEEGKPVWVPGKIWLQTLMWSSIFPTKSQIRQFEASPAFLDMIYQDLSADQARMEERLRGRLLRTQQMTSEGMEGNEHVRDASNQVDFQGVASSSSSSDSSNKPAQDVKLTLKVMPWGEVKAWLRPIRRLEGQPRPKQGQQADRQKRQEALEFAQARCTDSRFEQLLEAAKSAESLRGQLKGVQQRVAALSREAREAESAQRSIKRSPAQPRSLPSQPMDVGHGSQSDSESEPRRNESQHGQSGSQHGQGDNQRKQRDGQHGQSSLHSGSQTRGSTGPGSGQGSATAVYSTSFGSVDGKGVAQLQVSADRATQTLTDRSAQESADRAAGEPTDRPAQASIDRAAGEPTDRPAQFSTDRPAQASTDRAAGEPTGRPAQVSTDRAAGVDQSCSKRESGKLEGSCAVELAGIDMADFAAKADSKSPTQRSRAAWQQPQGSRETAAAQRQQPQGSMATAAAHQGQEPSGKDHIPYDGNTPSLAEEKQALLVDLKGQEKALQRRFAQLQLQVNAALDSLCEELRGV